MLWGGGVRFPAAPLLLLLGWCTSSSMLSVLWAASLLRVRRAAAHVLSFLGKEAQWYEGAWCHQATRDLHSLEGSACLMAAGEQAAWLRAPWQGAHDRGRAELVRAAGLHSNLARFPLGLVDSFAFGGDPVCTLALLARTRSCYCEQFKAARGPYRLTA